MRLVLLFALGAVLGWCGATLSARPAARRKDYQLAGLREKLRATGFGLPRALLLAVLLAGTVSAADIKTTVGIYGSTLRIAAGAHDGMGANVQCYSYENEDGTAIEYFSCFDWNGNTAAGPGFAPGPNCTLDPAPGSAVECNLEEHPVTAFDVRFRDADTPNSVGISGYLPSVRKLSLKGSSGEDQFGQTLASQMGSLLIFPNVLSVKLVKKAGRWRFN